MMLPLRVSPSAAHDVSSAAEWYDSERAGLGRRFLAEVKRVSKRVQHAPGQLPLVDDGVRRALLRTFPYAMFFSVESDAIVVPAVLHLRRDPEEWRRRPQSGK